MIRRNGEFPFPWELLKKPSDANTQVSSALEMGCEDGNFLFPDSRGQAGTVIIFCYPTCCLCSEGAEGVTGGSIARARGVHGGWPVAPTCDTAVSAPQLGKASCPGRVCG